MPARTQTKSSQEIEKLKETKPNKNILIAKTLEAFKPKAIFLTLRKFTSKICSKPIFRSKIGPV